MHAENERNVVLVVDDENAVRHVQERLLARAGYDVISCASADEALDALERHSPEIAVALVDVFMPETNGHELAAAIRERYRDVKIVMVSGGMTGEMEDASGFDGLLEKPFTGAMLLAEVGRHLDGKQPAARPKTGS